MKSARPLLALACLVAAVFSTSCVARQKAAARAPAPAPVSTSEILALTHDPSAKLIVVNVWATWCAPCREEIPALVQLHEEMAADGVKVVLVCANQDPPMDNLIAFLTDQGVTFPTYLKTEADEKKFIADMNPDWSGAIPATFVYGPDGQLRDFWEGKATFSTFLEKVRAALAG